MKWFGLFLCLSGLVRPVREHLFDEPGDAAADDALLVYDVVGSGVEQFPGMVVIAASGDDANRWGDAPGLPDDLPTGPGIGDRDHEGSGCFDAEVSQDLFPRRVSEMNRKVLLVMNHSLWIEFNYDAVVAGLAEGLERSLAGWPKSDHYHATRRDDSAETLLSFVTEAAIDRLAYDREPG